MRGHAAGRAPRAAPAGCRGRGCGRSRPAPAASRSSRSRAGPGCRGRTCTSAGRRWAPPPGARRRARPPSPRAAGPVQQPGTKPQTARHHDHDRLGTGVASSANPGADHSASPRPVCWAAPLNEAWIRLMMAHKCAGEDTSAAGKHRWALLVSLISLFIFRSFVLGFQKGLGGGQGCSRVSESARALASSEASSLRRTASLASS